MDSEGLLFLLRSRKPKHEAHNDRSQFELSTWSSSGKKELSLNLATSNNVSLTSRGHWTLVIGPRSFTANRSSFDQQFVAFRGGSRVRSMRSGTQSNFLFFFFFFFFYRSLESGKVKPFTKLTNFTKSFVQKPFALEPVSWRFR